MRRPNEFAIDFDVIAFTWLRAEIRARPAVDRDTARCNQFVAITTRTNAGGGEIAIETHRCTVAVSLCRGEWVSRRQSAVATHLRVGFCLGQADNFRSLLPLTALLQQLDTLEAFQNIALRCNCAGSF